MSGSRNPTASGPADELVQAGYWRHAGSVVCGAAGSVTTGLLLGHRWIPNYYGAGSAVDTALPWLGLLSVVSLVCAVVLRARYSTLIAGVGAVVATVLFGPALVHRPAPGPHDLRVATLNVGADNPDPARTARAVADAGADLVALQELTDANNRIAQRVLDPSYPFRHRAGTVGLWSKLPLAHVESVDIDIGWVRALRAQVSVEGGAMTVFVAHLASARPGLTADRDHTLSALADRVMSEGTDRVLVVGDLNTAPTDRKMAEFSELRDTQLEGGRGLGFTYPAALPVMRPDHILQRRMHTRRAWVTRVPGSDHRLVLADLDTTA